MRDFAMTEEYSSFLDFLITLVVERVMAGGPALSQNTVLDSTFCRVLVRIQRYVGLKLRPAWWCIPLMLEKRGRGCVPGIAFQTL